MAIAALCLPGEVLWGALMPFGGFIFGLTFFWLMKTSVQTDICIQLILNASIGQAKTKGQVMIFEYKKKIYGYECDIYSHLNNANYLMLLEAARSEAMEVMDTPLAKLLQMGIQFFVLRYELDYLKAVELEDTVLVRSWFYSTNRIKGLWQQEIYNSRGDLCFVAHLTVVYAQNGKAKRLPPEISDHFLKYVHLES
jgi:YbgC/YbaW family acyl-CoA thioester hydrolase